MKKCEMNVFGKVPILACFLVKKIKGLKKWVQNDEFLPNKRFWPSFPEAEILHGAAKYLYHFFIFYGSTSKNAIKICFFHDEVNQ